MNEKKKTNRAKDAVSITVASILTGGAIVFGMFVHDSIQSTDTSAAVASIEQQLAESVPVSEFEGQVGLAGVLPVGEFAGKVGMDEGQGSLPAPDRAQAGEAYGLIEHDLFGTHPLVMGSKDGDVGVNDDLLDHGLVSYGTLASPGEVGNFAVSGHRTLDGFLSTPDGILRDVTELREGDVVTVRTVDGTYEYEVITESFKVLPDTKGILDSDPLSDEVNTTRKLMTIQTCGVGGAEVAGEWKANGLDYREIIVLELVEG